MHKNSYGPKTLNGNWLEERSSQAYAEKHEVDASHLAGPNYSKFIPISKDVGNKKEYVKEPHDSAVEDWLQFQKTFTPTETYKTTNMVEVPAMETRSEKFALKGNNLTKDEKAMEEYRARWTTGNHQFPRTYLGAE